MKIHYFITMFFIAYCVDAFSMDDIKEGSVPVDIPTSSIVNFFTNFSAACKQSTSKEYLNLFAKKVRVKHREQIAKFSRNNDTVINRWKSVHCKGHLPSIRKSLGDVSSYRYGMLKIDRKTSSYHVLCVYDISKFPEKCTPIVRAEMENSVIKIGER